MPVDCKFFFDASPQQFHSYHNGLSRSTVSLSSNKNNNNSNNNINKNMRNRLQKMPLTIPLRPILIIRSDSGSEMDGATSPTNKLKKRVMFADEKGNPLTEIKWMSEPSNFPPQWNDAFVEQVTKGASATAAVPIDKWEVGFAQPVSDYVGFRTKLEEQCVCLENMMIKHAEKEAMGTIKVKNLAYDKEVFVRVTFDGWKSYRDFSSSHVPSPTVGTSVYELFDTFTFTLSTSEVKGHSIEFCICFRCSNREFWDNNNRNNYKLILTTDINEMPSKEDATIKMFKYEDALKAQLENWTEFASWQHLVNDAPYW